MGLSRSDIHQILYANYLKSGLTHQQAIQQIPFYKRAQFLKDINKTSIESHFGIKDHWFLILVLAAIIGFVTLVIWLHQHSPLITNH